MLQGRTCPHGHHWESADPAGGVCPVCASADNSWDRSQSSTFPADEHDELPPPPDAMPRTLKQDLQAAEADRCEIEIVDESRFRNDWFERTTEAELMRTMNDRQVITIGWNLNETILIAEVCIRS